MGCGLYVLNCIIDKYTKIRLTTKIVTTKIVNELELGIASYVINVNHGPFLYIKCR